MPTFKLKNIIYRLEKFEKALVFQILEQDESWMACYRNNEILRFISKNGYTISSCLEHRPSISDSGVIHLQRWDYGSECYRVSILNWFHENKKRNQYYTKINEALAEWDEHVEKLKEKGDE